MSYAVRRRQAVVGRVTSLTVRLVDFRGQAVTRPLHGPAPVAVAVDGVGPVEVRIEDEEEEEEEEEDDDDDDDEGGAVTWMVIVSCCMVMIIGGYRSLRDRYTGPPGWRWRWRAWGQWR
jgi:hypothetical protein